jgi:magnesium-transporting ATPase (P-type)
MYSGLFFRKFESFSSGIRVFNEDFVPQFSTCIIIFQNLVPISLYVTVEIVKTIQAYFIHCDLEMYDKELDKPCSVRSWNLSVRVISLISITTS